MANNEADFIHVRSAHNLLIAAFSFDYGNHVTHVIHGDGISQRRHLADNQITNSVLKTGSSGRLAKFLEKLDIHRTPSIR